MVMAAETSLSSWQKLGEFSRFRLTGPKVVMISGAVYSKNFIIDKTY